MSINEMVLQHQNLVHYTLSRYFLSFKDDEDIVQVGMIGLWKACATFDESKGYKFSTYAIRCIRNEVCLEINKIVRQRKLNCISLDNTLGQHDFHTHLDMLRDQENYISMIEIREILDELPEEDRRLLQLRYEGFTYKEIGDMFGYSKSRAEQHIRRIQKKVESACA